MTVHRSKRRLSFGLKAFLVFVAMVSVILATAVYPVTSRKRMLSWVEANGGFVDRFHKPQPDVIDSSTVTLIRQSYLRILGPEDLYLRQLGSWDGNTVAGACRMKNSLKWLGAVVLTLASWDVAVSHAETVVLRSGNGVIGGNDTLISMLPGPANTNFATAFTAADFSAADSGPAAFIIANHPAWLATLPSDPLARWISTAATGAAEGGTALYAIDFALASAALSATLDLRFAVDNALGGGPNQGVFLNGTAVSGNSTGAGFTSELFLQRNDIAPLLVAGTNTLYLNATDQGGPGGLIFSATIETVPIPEPASLLLFLSSAAGVIACAKARIRRMHVLLCQRQKFGLRGSAGTR